MRVEKIEKGVWVVRGAGGEVLRRGTWHACMAFKARRRTEASPEVAAELYAERVHREVAAEMAHPNEPTEEQLAAAYASAYEGKLSELTGGVL